MHHSRVQQEKARLNHDIENLKKLHKDYEENYQNLSNKYEAAMKEKMLLKLERDRLMAKSESLQKTVENLENKISKDNLEKSGGMDDQPIRPSTTEPKQTKKLSTQTKWTPYPEDRQNPFMNQTLEQFNTKSISNLRNFKKVFFSGES